MSISSKAMMLTAISAVLALSGCNNLSPATGTTVVSDVKPATQAPISYEALSRYNWTLVSATDQANQPLVALNTIKEQVVLKFAQQNGQNITLFSVGCNNMAGQYTLSGNVLNIANVRQTMMGCGELSGAESLLNNLMQGSSQLTLQGAEEAVLTQVTANNTKLVWQGKLTPQAKYNQKGETIFWAVKGDTQTCADGFGGTKSCLQILPLSYNEQGQKIPQGQWQLFNGAIEGYEHNESSNQVLRLTRYVVNAPHVKGKQYAYVLDQVVESEVAQ